MINVGDVGRLFTTNGKDGWRLIAYAAEPTVVLENLETKERIGGVVGSLILEPFKRLVEEKP